MKRESVAEVLTKRNVFDEGQNAIAEVLPPRHSAAQRLLPRTHAAAEDHIADAKFDQADGVRNHASVILIIRVDHHDDIRAVLQRILVTSLLIAAIHAILRMNDDRQAHLSCDGDGVVRAAVVDENDLIDAAGRKIR